MPLQYNTHVYVYPATDRYTCLACICLRLFEIMDNLVVSAQTFFHLKENTICQPQAKRYGGEKRSLVGYEFRLKNISVYTFLSAIVGKLLAAQDTSILDERNTSPWKSRNVYLFEVAGM